MNMNMNMRNNNNDNNGSKNFNHSNDVNSNNHYADFMLNQTMEDSLLFSPPLDSQQTQPRSLSPILEENQEQQQQPVSLLMEYLEEDVHPHTSEDLGVDTGEDEDELGTSILAVPEEDNDEEEVPDAKEHDNCISAALYSSLKEEEEEDDDDDDGSMSHIKYNSNRIRKNVNDDCEENDTRKDCDLESDDHPTVYVHSQLVSSTASSNFNEKVSRSSSISSGSITTDNVIYDPDLIHRKDHLENDINLRNHMEDPSKCASDLCDNDGDDNEDHNRTDDEANDNPHGITFHPTFQPLSPSTDDDNENKNDKTVKACHNHIRHNNEDVAIMSSSSKLQTKLSSTSKLSCSSTITANATTPKRRMSSSTSDFSSAQKAINSTSNAFLSRLQAAGKQRLLQVNRVRKLQCEQQRKRVNEKEKEEEAVKTVPAQRSTNKPRPSTTSAISKQMKVESVSIYRPFTARKLPPYAKSGYGQVGVPRVAKMESTIPKSPKLGPHNQSMAIAKMRQKMKAAAAIAATQESKLQPSNTNEINRKGKPTLLSLKSNPYKLFYARPIPKGVLDSINDEGIKRDFPRGSKIRQSLPAHRNDIGVSQRQSVSYKSGSHVGRNLRPFQIKAGSEVRADVTIICVFTLRFFVFTHVLTCKGFPRTRTNTARTNTQGRGRGEAISLIVSC